MSTTMTTTQTRQPGSAPGRNGAPPTVTTREVPALIDAHVHSRHPGPARREGITNLGRAALAGGVTTVFDMPNSEPPTNDATRLAAKRRAWRRHGLVDFGLFVAARPDRATPAALGIAPTTIAALKVFMAPSGPCPAITDPDRLAELLLAWPRLAVHAEHAAALADPGGADDRPHADRRPRAAVRKALATLEEALTLAERRRRHDRSCPPPGRLILLHVATADEVAWVRRLKDAGCDLVAETCHHYLFFTSSDAVVAGGRLQVNPPLREEADRAAVRAALADGTIDLLSSDHAPHHRRDKLGIRPPSGIAAIEWAWPLLAAAVDHGWLSWERAIQLASAAPATAYGLPCPGDRDTGDRVVLTREPSWQRGAPITRAGDDPYRGITRRWEVERVTRAGVTVFAAGRFLPGPRARDRFAAWCDRRASAPDRAADGPVALPQTGVWRRHRGGNGAPAPIVGDDPAGPARDRFDFARAGHPDASDPSADEAIGTAGDADSSRPDGGCP